MILIKKLKEKVLKFYQIKIKVKKGLLKIEAKNLYDTYIVNRTKNYPM